MNIEPILLVTPARIQPAKRCVRTGWGIPPISVQYPEFGELCARGDLRGAMQWLAESDCEGYAYPLAMLPQLVGSSSSGGSPSNG
jgi:hypothetical protein